MASKDSSRGKAWERAAARMFGFRRRTNGEHGGFDDCVQIDGGLAPISIEAKAHAKVQLRETWLEQARRNAGDRPWIVAQRPKGWRRPIGTVDLEWLRDLCVAAGVIAPTTQPEEEQSGERAS